MQTCKDVSTKEDEHDKALNETSNIMKMYTMPKGFVSLMFKAQKSLPTTLQGKPPSRELRATPFPLRWCFSLVQLGSIPYSLSPLT